MIFEVPREVFGSSDGCVVSFLDADSLFYINHEKQGTDKREGQNEKNIYEIYRLSISPNWQRFLSQNVGKAESKH